MQLGIHFVNFTLPGGPSTIASTLAETADAAENGDVLLSRAAMALEELAEWVTAHARGDLVAAADAWADRAYVLGNGRIVLSGSGATLLADDNVRQAYLGL